MDPLPPPSHVREIGSTRPQLRRNLRFSFQEFNRVRCCLIEDPLTSKFHRIGLAEYRFLSHLNGKVTFAEAFARASLESGPGALNEQQAIAVLSWLVENRLATLGGTTPDEVVAEAQDKQFFGKLRNAFNVLFIRVPLGRPDRFLTWIYPTFQWMCGWAFLLLWVGLVIHAITQVSLHWDRLVRGTEGILAPDNWLWLALVWVGLKLWHEIWHGLICKHYGGEIREAGVLLVLFTPLGYVDASSSWAFPSKWKRIHVAAAGMYGEFFLAAIAAWVWSQTEPGLVNTLALNTMVMASTITLFFNLNPLMRFDGYFILSDLLELPNLYTRSTQLIKLLAKHWLLGVRGLKQPDWHLRETWIYLFYGLASLLWRVFIVFTLLIAASFLFKGGGLLLAVIGFFFWIIPIVSGLYRYMKDGHGQERPILSTALFRCGLLVLLCVLLAWIPLRVQIRAPGLLQFSDQVVLRADCPGFINGIHVLDGMDVEEGALLVSLNNELAENQLDKLAKRYEKQALKTRLAHLHRQFAEYAAEKDSLQALYKQFQDQRVFVESLDIRAPHAGRVVGPWLPLMRERYVNTGDEILRLAKPYAGEVAIPVSQHDIDSFRRHVGQPVSVRIRGRRLVLEGNLRRVTARASTQIDYPALTSLGGGPLAVKQKDSSLSPDDAGSELVTPLFWALVDISENRDFPLSLRAGERADIRFRSNESRSIGYLTYAQWTRFFNWVFTRASAEA